MSDLMGPTGEPLRVVPLLTEGARRFLDTLIGSRGWSQVLEFGIGGSTIWLNALCHVTTVEHNRKWIEAISPHIDHERWRLIEHPRPYFDRAKGIKGPFDLILIDGRDRVECAKAVVDQLKPGGFLMLDNAEQPRYAPIGDIICRHWNQTSAIQRRPDEFGFGSSGWTTTWWEKPCIA